MANCYRCGGRNRTENRNISELAVAGWNFNIKIDDWLGGIGVNLKECWDHFFLCFVMMKVWQSLFILLRSRQLSFITEFEGLCSEVYTFIKLKYNVGHVGIWLWQGLGIFYSMIAIKMHSGTYICNVRHDLIWNSTRSQQKSNIIQRLIRELI